MWTACEVARWVKGTTSSYAWATQAGLSRLGSNKTLTSSVLVVFGSRRAMTASSLPLLWDVVRLHHRQRCAQKPSPIAGSKLFTRDARRELYDIFGNIVGSVVSPLLANIYLHELDRYMERYTGLQKLEREKRKRHGLANFLYVRYADDWVVLCDGTREQADALRRELSEFLKQELKLELSMEKTRVTHVSEGFVFLGFLMDRSIVGSGKWAPRIRIPANAVEKVRRKMQAALAPETHRDSVRTRILGLNRIIGGWCRYYQTTSSPAYYFGKLGNELFLGMAHWLGRKYELSMPQVMRRFRQGNSFGTSRTILGRPEEFTAQRHRLRTIPNPYTPEAINIQREELDSLEEEWVGTERRRGEGDRKEEVYQRDNGICGICGNFVPWDEAELDHRIPRARFNPLEGGDRWENLQILHANPCHQMKTKRDRQGGRRVR